MSGSVILVWAPAMVLSIADADLRRDVRGGGGTAGTASWLPMQLTQQPGGLVRIPVGSFQDGL
jgi:hypothetical protein